MKTIKHIWNKWEGLIASLILWLSKKTRYNVDNEKTDHFITYPNKSANIFQIFFNAVSKLQSVRISFKSVLISI
ncbi:MAG: hypothetical protein HYW86_05535 [Candidatus Roizmanbacteria bacterium]|nr:MAG: hypothetical protein HYW86_05535 [Candidatus Roizmanbacteria bacterium]